MDIRGHVQNGIVVLEGHASLPEGAEVLVIYQTAPKLHFAENQRPVEFPLVPSLHPGSVHLTNEMIADILDQEDASP